MLLRRCIGAFAGQQSVSRPHILPQLLKIRWISTEAEKDVSKDLSWVEFFELRKKQRRINVGSSVFTAFLGCNISWAYLSTMEIDPTQTIFGFDPLAVISAGIGASGVLGYLLGPLMGTKLFNVTHREKLKGFEQKNKEFLKRIIENRVDASSHSFSNPVPDYYGEKIGSLKEYRQWLRDCHAFRRKAREFL
ncbi:hypothetical protein HG535_0C00640 [Zygotorulaspora mrakii]|uniref:Presequence translocated-associated motor subunit PAM17 n=1 Tax=Zygotorulaspora mrakii TaxID=42260 RepID=A0A7H9AZ69_ZYGMR|nr:uncharacterized protein HG535_0C00640 [Zygotorulaspora mrakii]QLG71715.1 hypothetical protein HG535_0C00640 [Zygotorulaspora mrakii]